MATGNTRLNTTWLWAIIGAALILRVIYLILYAGLPEWTQLTVDNYYHHHWALDIAGGNIIGDTTYFRAPLYVWCLALLYTILGSSLWVGRIFGLITGLVSVWMTVKIGRRVFSNRAGLIAGAIHAIYPIAMYFEAELLLDSFFLLLLQIAFYRFLIWLDTASPRDLFWLTLAVGFASLTRPAALLMVVLIVAALVVKRSERILMPRQILYGFVGLAITIGPVFARNLAVAGDPVLISSQTGINLYIGNNEVADGVTARLPEPLGHNWQIADITWIAEQAADTTLTPRGISSYWSGRAIDWMVENPGRAIGGFFEKLYRTISNREISNNRSLVHFLEHHPLLRVNPINFGLVFVFAIIGTVAFIARNRAARWILALIILYSAAVALFFFSSRFRLPLLPFYFVLAAAGLVYAVDMVRHKPVRLSAPIAAGVVAGVLSFVPIIGLPAAAAPQVSLAAANAAYARGEYRTALEDAREARRIDPEFPEVHLVIGNAFVRLGQLDSAKVYYRLEQQLHPERVKAYSNLASIMLVEGRPEVALQLSLQAFGRRPFDLDANRIYIRSLFAMEDLPRSHVDDGVRLALSRTDNNIYLLTGAGLLYTEAKRYVRAKTMLSDALSAAVPPIETDDAAFSPTHIYSDSALNQQRGLAAYQLSYLYGIQGEKNPSIQFSRRAIEIDSSLVPAWVNLVSGLLTEPASPHEADSVLTLAERRFPGDDRVAALRKHFNQRYPAGQ